MKEIMANDFLIMYCIGLVYNTCEYVLTTDACKWTTKETRYMATFNNVSRYYWYNRINSNLRKFVRI